MTELADAEIREAVKEVAKDAAKDAIKEFLDEKFAAFGKWSMASIGAMCLAALVYFILLMNGWHK